MKAMDDYYLDPASDDYMTTSVFTKAEARIFWRAAVISLCIIVFVPAALMILS